MCCLWGGLARPTVKRLRANRCDETFARDNALSVAGYSVGSKDDQEIKGRKG